MAIQCAIVGSAKAGLITKRGEKAENQECSRLASGRSGGTGSVARSAGDESFGEKRQEQASLLREMT